MDEDARASALAQNAADYIGNYRYHDRLWYKRLYDEQETRDRPLDLLITFDRNKMNAALAG